MKAKRYTRETIRDLGVSPVKFPQFEVGDAIAVTQRIPEGDKERLQVFEGDVLCIRNKGAATTFTVRKISANAVGVERIFPLYSPLIESISVVHKGEVRRAKLFYMRNRVGNAARVKKKILTKEQKSRQGVE